jgi:hypothetical protein
LDATLCSDTLRIALGATVTFLLRSPAVFDQDETIQSYAKKGKARLIQGDALVKDDVSRAWSEAEQGDDNRPVDFLLFTVGAYLFTFKHNSIYFHSTSTH